MRPVSRTGKRKQKLTKERMIEKNQQKKEREFEREREKLLRDKEKVWVRLRQPQRNQ